jgi:hypothetical protein
VGYVVFSQSNEQRWPLVALLQNARRFFDISVDVLEEHDGVLRVAVGRNGAHAHFRLTIEAASPALYERARTAETAGRAAGMATLAARCPTIWRIEPEGEAPAALTLKLAGLLASVALGPVLPPDDSTLFGVRGAQERAQKA